MTEQTTLRILKIVMIIGFALLVLGHYFWSGLKLHEQYGVNGIIIIAGTCALGLILSLPTKIYLTIVFMRRERNAEKPSE